MTSVCVQFYGESGSFEPTALPFNHIASIESADVLILAGTEAGLALDSVETSKKRCVLVELGTECLGVWTGESRGREGSNILGFSRFRLGNRPASDLVEIVRQPNTTE